MTGPLECQICKRPGHSALTCWYRFDNAYQTESIPTALAAVHLEDVHGSDWFPDTGASAHITADLGMFKSPLSPSDNDSVMIGDGTRLSVTHIGNTTLHTDSIALPLHDVLVVPQIKQNLLSVSKLTDDYPCSFIFDKHGVTLKDLQTNRIVQIGHKHNGLYRVHPHTTQVFFTHLAKPVPADIWHQRLAHANFNIVNHLRHQQLLHCSPKTSSSSVCSSCQIAKTTALPFALSKSVSTTPLATVHCDVWGPSPVPSFQHFQYYVIFVDDFSRYSWLYPMKKRTDFYDIFVMFHKLVERQFECSMKVFHCDSGGEFLSHRFKDYLTTHGIKQTLSCPHTPEQNGIAERKHRHVTELGLALLYHAHVPLQYWVDSFMTANYVINRLPTAVLHMQTPFFRLHHKHPTYDHLRVFGCSCYPCLRPYATHKFDPRSLLCVFLGYSELHKGYRCLLPTNGRIYVSRHVVFDETTFPFLKVTPRPHPSITPLYQQWLNERPLLHSQPPSPASSPPSSISSPAILSMPPPSLLEPPASAPSPPSPSPALPSLADPEATATSSSHHLSHLPSPSSVPLPPSSSPLLPLPGPSNRHPMHTRSQSGILKPNPKYTCLVAYNIPPEPKSVRSALTDVGWTRAMQEEIAALHANNTWELVPRTPDLHVIGCKWVFKAKLAADGSLDRLKARLVAKGFHQEEGVDFTETFSPVIKQATIRIVLSVAMIFNWPLHQLDVKNAFLHGDLTETVYMDQPPGFISTSQPHHICRLKKSLYGLRQALCAWFDKFSTFLLETGFFCSSTDPSLFVLHHSHTVLLLLYVDDIILTGSSASLLQHLISQLHSHFHMKDLGALHYFLGIEAHRTAQTLYLCQTKYALDLLNKAYMADCKPFSTPLSLRPPHLQNDDVLLTNPFEYRSLVGGLQYLTLTRPDLAYATNLLCQQMHAPTVGDFSRLKRVLRYVKGTLHCGLFLRSQSAMHLYGFSDADWASCPTTRRSTTGFCLFLGSNLIFWSAKRQPTVSRSSTEAEYRALASAAADLTWVTFVLRDIGISLPTPSRLFCDNQSALALTNNPVLHARTKHIEIDFHFVREKVTTGSLRTCYVPSALQVADIFTKPLTKFSHLLLSTKLGMGFSPPPNLRGDVKHHTSNTIHKAKSTTDPEAESRITAEVMKGHVTRSQSSHVTHSQKIRNPVDVITAGNMEHTLSTDLRTKNRYAILTEVSEGF